MTISNGGQGNGAYVRPRNEQNSHLFLDWSKDHIISYIVHSSDNENDCRFGIYKDQAITGSFDKKIDDLMGVTTITSPVTVLFVQVGTSFKLYLNGEEKANETKDDWSGSTGFIQVTTNLSNVKISDFCIVEH